mgnify:FL=1
MMSPARNQTLYGTPSRCTSTPITTCGHLQRQLKKDPFLVGSPGIPLSDTLLGVFIGKGVVSLKGHHRII